MAKEDYKILESNVVALEVDLESNNSTSPLLGPFGRVERLGSDAYVLGELEESPSGRTLGVFSTVMIYISKILGSGIFASSSIMYDSCNRSPFYFCLAWLISYAVAFSGLFVYLELGAMIPRNGGTKVFLEVIYNKPLYLTSVIFALQSIVFGFAILSPLIFGDYFLQTIGLDVTDFRSRLTGFAFLFAAGVFHAVSYKHGLFVQNLLGIMKIALLAGLLITGIWVICFPTEVTGLENQLSWARFSDIKNPPSLAKFSNAITMASFTMGGWHMGHTNQNEVKDPVRTYKIAGPLAMIIIMIGYAGINACYLSVLTDAELATSGSLVGAKTFEKIYGSRFGKTILTAAISVSTGGNIWVTVYSLSRLNQEVFREGYLPYSKFMASNRPFNTPMNTIVLLLALSALILLIAPAGGVYGYIVSFEGYPVLMFTLLAAVGVLILRKRYPEYEAPIKANIVGIFLIIVIMVYVLTVPFLSGNPNPQGTESWISYPLLAWIFALGYVVYWFCMFRLGPRFGGYDLVQETEELEDGLTVKKWTKFYN